MNPFILVIMATLTVARRFGGQPIVADRGWWSNGGVPEEAPIVADRGYWWSGGVPGVDSLMGRASPLQPLPVVEPGLEGRLSPVPKKPVPMTKDLLTPLPTKPGWECSKNYEKHPLPYDCTGMYTCKECKKSPSGWCYTASHCVKGAFFDDRMRACVFGNKCPQSLDELPDGWNCDVEGEHHVVPNDCKQYYQCVECSKKSGWCYETLTCPEGKWFDDKKKTCVDNRCPQAPKILPPGWPCAVDGSLHVVPNDCTRSYRCFACEDGPWCYDGDQTCPVGQTFDDALKICVNGRCPQYPEINPPTWTCSQEGEKNVVPNNCSSSYICMKCPDGAPWCHTIQTCATNQTFDDKNKRCVDGRCPQHPPLLPENWNCTKELQKNVWPEDCTKYFVCHRFNREWTFKENQCPTGQTFDDTKKMCVQGKCPQEPPGLPDDWKCGQDGEKHAHPDDCTQFYTCKKPENATEWSYELEQCPSDQTFNEQGGSCQDGRCPQHPPPLPAGFECKKDGELRVHPESCEEYYKCIKFQEKDWTYELKKCTPGNTFDNKKQACVAGRCPQFPPKLISGWKCESENELNQLPKDCSQYYKCINCPDGGWCYAQFRCREYQKFDSTTKQCTSEDITCEGTSDSSSSSSSEEGLVSPTISPPVVVKPAPGILHKRISPLKPLQPKCMQTGQRHAIQNECQCYHLCTSWLYEDGQPVKSIRLCCKNGKYFDRQRNVCTKGICPYKKPKIGYVHREG